MKMNTEMQRWFTAALCGCIVVLVGSPALGQNLILCDFATDVSCISQTGGVTPTYVWSATGNPGGSAYVTIPWANASGWQDSQIDFNQTVDCTAYSTFECDVMVDTANSTLTDSGDYGSLQFVAQSWSGGQGWTIIGTVTITNTTGWQHFSVPFGTSYESTANQFVLQFYVNQWGSAPYAGTCAYWLDNVILTSGASPVTNIPVAITVDAQLNRHSISPQIYGVAFASSNQLSDLNLTMNRSGGNNETRYNWQINAHNLDADWYFESYPDSSATPGATADSFVANSKGGGAQAMITIPMIGWAPYLGSGRSILWSYSTNKYGPQTSVDPWRTDAGNGISITNDTPITWNNPNDANFPTNTAFEQTYVQHLMGNWGASTNGGVGYYLMDNEHSIWFSTHQDIHPVGPTMQEIWTKMLATASMVKSNDPNALVLGPEEWGWSGYFYSGYDQQNPGYHDRATNGGWDYMPWLLNQFHQYATTNSGPRLLDYFTLHCYPQEGDVSGDDVSTTTALLRNQCTRVFWDTNYVDPSWIGEVIMLIPRMKGWVASYYPGTKIGVTEYNWGAEADINGATAQADILGIFGWQSLDLATRWTVPDTGTPTYNAMKIYRNYDGNKSTFGDTSVSDAVSTNVDLVSSFAAVRSSDGSLTVMVINKQLTASASASFTITNFAASGTAHVWQLNSSNVITRLSDLSFAGSVFSNTVPAQSITLFVLPPVIPGPASNPNPASGATGVAVNTSLSWKAGTNATLHCMYFGTSSNAVANATTNSPQFMGGLTVTNYTPGTLAYNTSYYWRVDEMAGAYATYTTTGAVWTFTTPVLAGPASNPNPANGATGVAVNTSLSWTAGSNATLHRVYFGTSSNVVASATTNSPQFMGGLAVTTYTPGTLAYSTSYYWRVDEMAGAYATTGAVWTFTTPVLAGPASNPNPASGATGVAVNTSLSWTAGTNATLHRVYFGTSSNAVVNATTNSPEFKGALASAGFSPGVLAASGRFYWRVDELAGTYVTTGPVWTFATVVNGTGTFPLSGGLGSGDTFVISFPSQVGQTYEVERSPSLSPAAWSSVTNNVPGTGAPIQIPDTGGSLQAQRFYRVVVLSP
jgi:hypothetical protein